MYGRCGVCRPFENTLTGDAIRCSWPWLNNLTNQKNFYNTNSTADESSTATKEDHIHLFVLSDGHAGSTSLAGLLATSPTVATLCGAKVWQCK